MRIKKRCSLFLLLVGLSSTVLAQTWTPLYRLVTFGGGCQDHLYTTNPQERPAGYTFEGIECFVSSSFFSGSSQIYRLRKNANCPSHYLRLYTTSTTEQQSALNAGYVSENNQGYCNTSAVNGTVPIQRGYNNSIGDRFYTTSTDEYSYATSNGYSGEARLGDAYEYNITAPSVGSSLTGGSQFTITWYSRTTPDNNTGTYNFVALELHKGGAWIKDINLNVSNSGLPEQQRSYSWTVPTDVPTGSDYSIKIYRLLSSSSFETGQFNITNSSSTISVTVGTNPSSLNFSVDGIPYTTSQQFSWTSGMNHTISTSSALDGPIHGTSRFKWLNWNDNGFANNAIEHTITPTSNNSIYTANFQLQYFLNVNPSTGGAVSPASDYFDAYNSVQVSATPSQGYVFSGWAGSGTWSYTGMNNPALVAMSSPITETAHFTQQSAPIVVTSAPTNVTGNGAQLNGTINSNGLFNTYYYFEWGTSQFYGNNTGATGPNYFTQTTSVQYTMLGLAPGTTYHYRLLAWNGKDTSRGVDMAFTTTSLSVGITIIDPSIPGIVMQKNVPYTIRWTNTNYSGNVQVWLYKGTVPTIQISGNYTNTGTIDFTPGCDLEDGSDYRILIADAVSTSPSDFSDNDFQISSSSNLSKPMADVCMGIVRLKFPLKGTSASNPNPNDGPFTHDIISFFDHKRTDNYIRSDDGMMINFVGDTGLSQQTCPGTTAYKARDGRRFDAKVPNYQNPPANGYCGKDNVDYMFYDGHNGYDYKADKLTPIYPAFIGTAKWRGGDPLSDKYGYDYGVMELSGPSGYVVDYLHCSAPMVPDGPITDLSSPIAKSGEKGAEGAPHLHFELKYQGNVVDPYEWLGSDPNPWHANSAVGDKDLWEQRDVPYYVRATVAGFHIRIQWIYDGERLFLDHFKVFRQNNEEQPNIREFSVAPNPLGYYYSFDDNNDLVTGRTYRYYVQPFLSSGPLAHASAGVEIIFNPADHATQTMFAFSNSVAPLSVPTSGLYQVALNYSASSMPQFRRGTHSSVLTTTSADLVYWEMIDSSGEHFDNTSYNVGNYSSNGLSQSFVISLDSSQSGILNLSLAGTDNITLGDSVVISSQITPFSGAIFKVLSKQVDIDDSPIGSTVKDSFAIYNIGNQPLQVTLQYVGSSSFNIPSGSTTVSPSSSTWIVFSFTPTDTIESSGQVILTHNGATSPDGVSITGRGTYTVTKEYHVLRRWNLVSVPLFIHDGAKVDLFPSAISSAFAYEGSYVQKDTLTHGIGYWLKFTDSQSVFMTGTPASRETINVSSGWNLIGSISDSLPASSIGSLPAGMITSQFFGYDGYYFTTTMIVPSHGYWVKVAEAGKLVLASGGMTIPTNRIRILATSELPPASPEESSRSDLPKEFALQQNYPNPFNPSTSIKYQLPLDSRVSVKIYNVLGQIVDFLIDDLEPAGYKSIQWNATNLASGVYFYRLAATSLSDPSKSFVRVKKMLLLK